MERRRKGSVDEEEGGELEETAHVHVKDKSKYLTPIHTD
jgi:hypothetical protein